MSKILLNRIGTTCYSFVHQTLSLIKIQDSMPRQVPDAPQELFLTHDTNNLIASLPVFNSMMRQAQSNDNPFASSNDNPFASSNDNNQPFYPLINFHNASSCIKCKRPPPVTQDTIAKVVEHWIVNACDDTLDVTNPAYLNRKMRMKEKGVNGNFNKRKSIIGIVDRRVLVNKDRMEVAKELYVELMSSNLTLSNWWNRNKHKSADDATLMTQGSEV